MDMEDRPTFPQSRLQTAKNADLSEDEELRPLSGLQKAQESLDRVDKSIGDLTKSIHSLSTATVNPFAATSPFFPSPSPNDILSPADGAQETRIKSVDPQEHAAASVVGGDINNKQGAGDDKLRSPIRMIPQVRRCNWEQFKNRIYEEEGQFAIEVLESNSSLKQQMAEEDQIRRKVEEIIQDTQTSTTTLAEDQQIESVLETGSSDISPNKSAPNFTSKEALDELQCYIKFMDEEIVPDSRRFDNPALPKARTVRHCDLDYLFKIGTYIFINKDQAGQKAVTDQRIQRTFWTAASGPRCTCDTYPCEHDDSSWSLNCYYIDHNGDKYVPSASNFTLHFWEGEKDIMTLDFFPVQYLSQNGEADMAQARFDGANFVDHVSQRYSFYSGWSLTRGPNGIPMSDPKTTEPMKTPEHVESDVLIDLSEAFDYCPTWQPPSTFLSPGLPGEYDMKEKLENHPLIEWMDENRTTVKSSWRETVVMDQWIHDADFEKLLIKNPVLVHGDEKPPSGDQLALLPRRMFAYAVWDRKFVPIDSRYLKRSKGQGEEGEAFEQLQISHENKKLITALLQSHFRKKELELQGVEVPTQDLIRGKGRGIVILLHGVPGVGKTATAEAVAQKWKRPLFPITCGDLGFTPEKVESSLKEIFRLAHLWDCVLLLDEADVFIARREKNGADLQRNALVSVFLRMLEYYNGVLFLTTNRVGVLDEAIKSRVHLHLKYHQLNRNQTLEIFKHNIKRLRVIEQQRTEESSRLSIAENDILSFAQKHYDQHNTGSGIGMWNGRQIRNAFLIAASLAHYDGDIDRESDPNIQKQLRSSHFELVDRATMSYDQDRADIFGKTDSELAWLREERYDSSQDQIDQGNMNAINNVPWPQHQGQQYGASQHVPSSGNFHGPAQGQYHAQQAPQQTYNMVPRTYGGPPNEPRFS
ncbi:hypothetical protein N0V90_003423 [Kalmusia sp. IMI 367209]|nr:hypothetical protein N0V90_003423 [Kalmusia sp. IMI 367209]